MHLTFAGVGREQSGDEAKGGGLACTVWPEQAEDLSRLRLERDSAQDLVLAERLLEALHRDRGFRQLRFFGELFFDAVDFAAAAARLGAGLAAGFAFGAGFSFGAAGATAAAAGAGVGSGSGAAAAGSGSALATPIELERVRWHVSHVTIVCTSVPS